MTHHPGIYVHVPFCSAICPYCDFAVVRDSSRRQAFADRLVVEIERVAWTGPQGFDTLYFGGGTPSLLAVDDLARIIEVVEARFDCEPLRIHLEANPEDVTPPRVEEWRRLGVRFLSLGVQALDDRRLAFLGRKHDRRRALEAVEIAAGAAFATLSIDLIYGHREQHLHAWTAELAAAATLPVDHLSCYSLTISPRTPFGRRQEQGELLLLDEERQRAFFLTTHRTLADVGFEAYEISNFARAPEHRSRHNGKYWSGAPYLGLGPSAHSFDGQRRWWNERHELSWARRLGAGGSPVEAQELLTRDQRRLEAVMLGLRTSEGLDLDALAVQFGEDLGRTSGETLRDLTGRGLAKCEARRLVLTHEGWVQADRIAAVL